MSNEFKEIKHLKLLNPENLSKYNNIINQKKYRKKIIGNDATKILNDDFYNNLFYRIFIYL